MLRSEWRRQGWLTFPLLHDGLCPTNDVYATPGAAESLPRKFRLPRHTAHLYLLVMGATQEHLQLPGWGDTETDIPTFPYRFQVSPNY